MPFTAPTVASDPPTKAETDAALSTLNGYANTNATAASTAAAAASTADAKAVAAQATADAAATAAAFTTVKAGNVRALQAIRTVVVALYSDNQGGQAKSGVLAEIDAAITANGG